MAAFTTSASAVDIYSTIPEAAPLVKSPTLMSVYDSGVSVAAVEPSDLDNYLEYGNYSVAQFLASINRFLTNSTTPSFSGTSLITQIDETLSDYLESSGFYLDSDGDVNNVNYNNSISQLVRLGFLGLSTNLKSILTSISNLNIADYSSILTAISNSVDGLESGLTSANTAIGGVTTAVNNVRTAVNNVFSGLTTVNSSIGTVNTSVGSLTDSLLYQLRGVTGESYLNSSGAQASLTGTTRFSYLFRTSMLGLANHLSVGDNENYLRNDGTLAVNTGTARLSWLLRSGFLGLRALISGSETDNIYTSILNDNNNTTTTVNSTGLGPLLNKQLSNIGENLGHLAYVFANDEDIKLREDSQPLLDSTDSFYDDSDSSVKVSANNVGSLKDIAGNFTSIIDADADIGDAFAIVSNSNTYRWFSADVAMDLDSLGVATVDFEESTYDRLHREFNEIYFPDRVGGAS